MANLLQNNIGSIPSCETPVISSFHSSSNNISSKGTANELPSQLQILQNIFGEDLTWDAPIVQQFILIFWLKKILKKKKFIETKDIFDKYCKDFETINKRVILIESSFYKLISSCLLTAKIIYVKSRQKNKRGISGI